MMVLQTKKSVRKLYDYNFLQISCSWVSDLEFSQLTSDNDTHTFQLAKFKDTGCKQYVKVLTLSCASDACGHCHCHRQNHCAPQLPLPELGLLKLVVVCPLPATFTFILAPQISAPLRALMAICALSASAYLT